MHHCSSKVYQHLKDQQKKTKMISNVRKNNKKLLLRLLCNIYDLFYLFI